MLVYVRVCAANPILAIRTPESGVALALAAQTVAAQRTNLAGRSLGVRAFRGQLLLILPGLEQVAVALLTRPGNMLNLCHSHFYTSITLTR